MQILHIDTTEIRMPRETVVTIGNFDGVHAGHRRLIDMTKLIALAGDMASVVLTFDPHPITVLRGQEVPLLLTREEKQAAIADLGVDIYAEKAFTAALAQYSPAEFFKEVLVPLRCRHLVIGTDFRFGQKGAGDATSAAHYGADCGITVHTLPHVYEKNEKISSTRIRNLIIEHKFVEAATLLTRPYAMRGEVMRGAQRGRALGFPTLNLIPSRQKLLPPDGVYLTRTAWHGALYDGVTNIGTNPTFDAQTRTVETHLLNCNETLYGKTVTISFLGFLRKDVRFDSPAALQTAIAADVSVAQTFFAGIKSNPASMRGQGSWLDDAGRI